ncbi:ATP-dependent dethiobiotin synthetase BioD [Corynebacterium sp. NPDC060344]|uniref:ATP-dependent dethiobiotin synthetase BioD n=1 Tax=Corynebacterium sp. NPDC060344 TaxID=3347101 RepID=UPI003648FBE3
MTILCITGTGTDVGKTIATAAIAGLVRSCGREVVVVKPAQTGFPGTGAVLGRGGDLDDVERLTGVTDLHGFARYPEPMAPLAAARRAGMPTLRLDDAARRIRALDGPGRTVLVEGAGGLLVRLGADGGPESGADGGAEYAARAGERIGAAREWGLPDLAAALPCAKTVVVTSLGLGSLNTAELTVEVARGRGMDVIGLIGGSLPVPGDGEEPDAIVATNLEDLPHLTGVPVLGCVPEGAGRLRREDFLAAAPGWFTESGETALVG